MKTRVPMVTTLLSLALMVTVGCSSNASSIPVHPKAAESTTACPPEIIGGKKCYQLRGVSHDQAVEWFQKEMTARGWKAAPPPDDEPFTFIFTKDGQKAELTFYRHEEGAGLLVSLDQ